MYTFSEQCAVTKIGNVSQSKCNFVSICLCLAVSITSVLLFHWVSFSKYLCLILSPYQHLLVSFYFCLLCFRFSIWTFQKCQAQYTFVSKFNCLNMSYLVILPSSSSFICAHLRSFPKLRLLNHLHFLRPRFLFLISLLLHLYLILSLAIKMLIKVP